ncbi:hypothetical protein [Chitinophaga sp. CF418]|uniref:hypothetical protein n=1 Tax=Chitinophaga sp. CF418 TaxID=1855287 RepID=UPI00091F3037|nr:hypothetical protein [Chitinophaga sp. CF418]SHN40636.1 hypothetical protein SAMN05216311_11268 [Chitinophaga sp. CF418]
MVDKIDAALWQRYKQAVASGKELSAKFERGEITSDEFFVQLQADTSHELCELCAKSYCEKLTQIPEHERVTLYFNDIKIAAGADDLEMLLVLDEVPAESGIIVPVKIDEFLLSYYTGFFKRATNKQEIFTAQMLFERVLDTSDDDLDIYTRVMDEIFSMGKGEEWFAEFYRGVEKLLLRAPVNQETLQAMQKGVTGTGPLIKEKIESIIAYAYENRRKILVLRVQQDEGDTIALMQFHSDIEPEIGLELSSDDVICRIENFERSYEFGQLYNCLVTVIKGVLTEESSFEVQI